MWVNPARWPSAIHRGNISHLTLIDRQIEVGLCKFCLCMALPTANGDSLEISLSTSADFMIKKRSKYWSKSTSFSLSSSAVHDLFRVNDISSSRPIGILHAGKFALASNSRHLVCFWSLFISASSFCCCNFNRASFRPFSLFNTSINVWDKITLFWARIIVTLRCDKLSTVTIS